jgi:hypothetical protein
LNWTDIVGGSSRYQEGKKLRINKGCEGALDGTLQGTRYFSSSLKSPNVIILNLMLTLSPSTFFLYYFYFSYRVVARVEQFGNIPGKTF